MYNSTLFLTSCQKRGVWSKPRLGKMRVTHCVGGWMGPSNGLDGCWKSRHPRIYLFAAYSSNTKSKTQNM